MLWNKIAKLHEEKFMDLDIYDESYDFFSDQIEKENAEILELACGPGNIWYMLSQFCSRTRIPIGIKNKQSRR